MPGDTAVLRALRDLRRDATTDFFEAIDDASETWVAALLAGVVAGALLVTRRWPAALAFAIAFAVPVAVNPFVKDVFARPRPDVSPVPDDVSRYSFPAGHAVAPAAFFGALLLVTSAPVRGRVIAVAALVILLVAAAELSLGRHYPTDLVGGWSIAAAWVLAVSAFWSEKQSGRGRRRRAG